MILDSTGEPVRRSIGFVSRYERVRKTDRLIESLSVIGFETPADADEEEEETNAARNVLQHRTRRTD